MGENMINKIFIRSSIAILFCNLFFFSSKAFAENQCDFVVFSYDRPMQLYSFLESVEKHMSGYRKIGVLCRITQPFEIGYHIVQKRFPEVHFLKQSPHNPNEDFKPLLLDMLFGSFGENADYVIFAVDDIIVTDKIDLKKGMQKMQEVPAYGLYYRLGRNITYSYMSGKNQPPPSLQDVGDGYFIWQTHGLDADWGYPNTVDMTLYAKQNIQKNICKAGFRNPNEFEGHWTSDGNLIAMCLEQSKMVNLCINNVGEFRGRDEGTGPYSIPSLNQAFLKGRKINIDQFYRILNSSPHITLNPVLISR